MKVSTRKIMQTIKDRINIDLYFICHHIRQVVCVCVIAGKWNQSQSFRNCTPMEATPEVHHVNIKKNVIETLDTFHIHVTMITIS